MDKISSSLKGLVRPFVTVMVTTTFCYLSLIGIIKPEEFSLMTGVIITFWFGTRSNGNKKEEVKTMEEKSNV